MSDDVTGNVSGDELHPTVRSVEERDDEMVVVVRLSNTADRTLHYIADVRATRYDAATGRLTLALSDEGREIIPGAMERLPTFRSVDPGSEAQLTLRVPNRVIKLAPAASPNEVAFETYPMSTMQDVVVEIAWSDVPFYRDTRPGAEARLPAVNWQQFTAHTPPEPIPPGSEETSD